MLVLSREEVRRVDAMAIEKLGISSLVLMENAGRGAAEIIAQYLSQTSPATRAFILCGKGNNGGDGLVIARQLAIRGCVAPTLILGAPSELSADNFANWQIAKRLGLPVTCLTATEKAEQLAEGMNHLRSFLASMAPGDWLIDGLLGTGSTSAPRGLVAEAIRAVNVQCPKVIALDLPSGLDADTGNPWEPTINAQICLTFAASKPGLQVWQARTGAELRVVPIGIPESFVATAQLSSSAS